MGLKSKDNDPSIKDRVELKCSFFWWLEEIWGSRRNATVVEYTESIATSSDVLLQQVSQAMSQLTSQVASSMASQLASLELQPAYEPQAESAELFDWSASPTPQPPQHSPKPPPRTKKRNINIENPQHMKKPQNMEKDQHMEKPQHTEKCNITTLRPTLERKEIVRQKRHKSAMDVQLEIAKMQQDTARETAHIQAQSAQETAHEIAHIQAEAQIR